MKRNAIAYRRWSPGRKVKHGAANATVRQRLDTPPREGELELKVLLPEGCRKP